MTKITYRGHEIDVHWVNFRPLGKQYAIWVDGQKHGWSWGAMVGLKQARYLVDNFEKEIEGGKVKHQKRHIRRSKKGKLFFAGIEKIRFTPASSSVKNRYSVITIPPMAEIRKGNSIRKKQFYSLYEAKKFYNSSINSRTFAEVQLRDKFEEQFGPDVPSNVDGGVLDRWRDEKYME